MALLIAICSPDGAQRNPGTGSPHMSAVPDCATLHPGYGRDRREAAERIR
jgi:hypothetical protein